LALARTKPGRKRLAIPQAELALQPPLRHPRRHHRRRLQSLEQPHRPAPNHHLYRNARLGPYRSKVTAVGITANTETARALRPAHGSRPWAAPVPIGARDGAETR